MRPRSSGCGDREPLSGPGRAAPLLARSRPYLPAALGEEDRVLQHHLEAAHRFPTALRPQLGLPTRHHPGGELQRRGGGAVRGRAGPRRQPRRAASPAATCRAQLSRWHRNTMAAAPRAAERRRTRNSGRPAGETGGRGLQSGGCGPERADSGRSFASRAGPHHPPVPRVPEHAARRCASRQRFAFIAPRVIGTGRACSSRRRALGSAALCRKPASFLGAPLSSPVSRLVAVRCWRTGRALRSRAVYEELGFRGRPAEG